MILMQNVHAPFTPSPRGAAVLCQPSLQCWHPAALVQPLKKPPVVIQGILQELLFCFTGLISLRFLE